MQHHYADKVLMV